MAVSVHANTGKSNAVFSGCTSLENVNIPAVTSIGPAVFNDTGNTPLTITMGNTAPSVGTSIFRGGNKQVTVKVPVGATGYGESPTDTTTLNWGNAFRGMGWDGTSYLNGSVVNIQLTIVYE